MNNVQEIDVETLAIWQREQKSLRLIDVRSEPEFSQGMIPEGEQMPLHLLPLKVNEIEKDTEIVFYCRSGVRSAQACAYLAARGYKAVYNLKHGILAWAEVGFPLSSPGDALA
jgi:rhodanese-related sulfurtransferase